MNYDNFKISLKEFIKEAENLDPNDKILKLENVILESYLKGDVSLHLKDLWMYALGNSIEGSQTTLLDLILTNSDLTVEMYLECEKE